MAEWLKAPRLESVYTFTGIGDSNPSLCQHS